MAVPKRRTSSSKRNQRRANHDKVSAPAIVRCPNCGEIKQPHRVCGACGFYDGASVVAKAPAATSEG